MNAYIAADLADLRLAFSADDTTFTSAVRATAQEIARALIAPSSWGAGLEYQLIGWRRSAFSSRSGGDADLRLIFRKHEPYGLDVLSFGLRYYTDASSVYHIARKRL